MLKITFEKAVEIAFEQHQAGNFDRAESLYIEILRQDPGNVEAMHLLGVLATQGGKPEIAVELISAAIRRRPDESVFYYNLAEAYKTLNDSQKAADSFCRAAEINPDYGEAHNNLADLRNRLGQYVLAEAGARRAIELKPNDPHPYNVLGQALTHLNRRDDAISAFRAALAVDAEFIPAINNLAALLRASGKWEEAIESYHSAIQLEPALPELHNNLGAALIQMNRLEEAGSEFATAIELDPNHVEAINNLGATLKSLGQLQSAETQFRKAIAINKKFVEPRLNLAAIMNDTRRFDEALVLVDEAIELRPEMAACHVQRGIVLRELRRFDDALSSLRRAHQLAPDEANTLTAIGFTLLERGDLEEAMETLNRSIALKPDPVTHSNVLMMMNYHPGFTPNDLLESHRGWARQHELPLKERWRSNENDRSPNRQLRIGYVSPDFRGHSVAYFLEPLLANHDRNSFEIFGYAHIVAPDGNTWRLRAQIDHWRETAGKTPDELADLIRADKIDILVELAGHTANNSLMVFARKPAPVQINMIGFPSTTGLSAIDYRITDGLCDPPGEADKLNTERLIRLPHVFWAYRPPNDAPMVAPLPADTNCGRITFTSVNNFAKVTPEVQKTWAKLLFKIPSSQLIIQTSSVSSLNTQKIISDRFAAEGVESERLIFRPWSKLVEYLQLLTESDMTLDPFPFNGGTTTCHSLWMGAPVITLAGDRHASRMGLSMMTDIGLPEFVAHTPEEYVEIGVKMANDLPRLREIRAGMRERLKASHLLDGAGYTRDLEQAFRSVWRKWCETAS